MLQWWWNCSFGLLRKGWLLFGGIRLTFSYLHSHYFMSWAMSPIVDTKFQSSSNPRASCFLVVFDSSGLFGLNIFIALHEKSPCFQCIAFEKDYTKENFVLYIIEKGCCQVLCGIKSTLAQSRLGCPRIHSFCHNTITINCKKQWPWHFSIR